MTQRAENVPNSQALGAAALCLSAFLSTSAQDTALTPDKNMPTAYSGLDPNSVEEDLNSLVATGNWDARLPALPESAGDLRVLLQKGRKTATEFPDFSLKSTT